VGFGIDRRARPRKGPGLFRRAPDPRELAERLDRLARRMFKGAVRAPSRKRAPRSIELDLHAAAPAVIIAVTDDGELAVTGDTARLGPGYHVDVLTRLAPLLDELDYVWAEPIDVAAI
jgi:hypothetical protein